MKPHSESAAKGQSDAELVDAMLKHTRPVGSAAQDREVAGREAERMVETARAMVTAYDGMLGASFWIEYGALKSEIEEFERTWANVKP